MILVIIGRERQGTIVPDTDMISVGQVCGELAINGDST
jgi:hypothetical protein